MRLLRVGVLLCCLLIVVSVRVAFCALFCGLLVFGVWLLVLGCRLSGCWWLRVACLVLFVFGLRVACVSVCVCSGVCDACWLLSVAVCFRVVVCCVLDIAR